MISLKALFQSLIPSMVAVIASALEENAADPVRHGIDVFETLLILVRLMFWSPTSRSNTVMQETPLLAKHIPQLVEFFTNVGANRNLEGDNRVMALNALTWIIK
jgi:importin-4